VYVGKRGGLWHCRSEGSGGFRHRPKMFFFCPGKESVSTVRHQSSVISPGPKVSDPVLGVGGGRCAGDIPPSPGCAASRPHEHTPGGAVPSGTESDPEVTNRLPGYTTTS